jgi:hypothetical protein
MVNFRRWSALKTDYEIWRNNSSLTIEIVTT